MFTFCKRYFLLSITNFHKQLWTCENWKLWYYKMVTLLVDIKGFVVVNGHMLKEYVWYDGDVEESTRKYNLKIDALNVFTHFMFSFSSKGKVRFGILYFYVTWRYLFLFCLFLLDNMFVFFACILINWCVQFNPAYELMSCISIYFCNHKLPMRTELVISL